MIERLIPQRRRSIGGLEVGRVLPVAGHRMVGPFIFFDHLGPLDLPPGIPPGLDVLPHPHIGLATVTYLLAGEATHRDSLGTTQVIRPGEVNWMTAGRGITHSERFERARREGMFLHGLQAWVALPVEHEECAPAFAHHEGADLPGGAEQGCRWQLIAGSLGGVRAAVPTLSPLFYLRWELGAGARATLPADYPERAAYVVSGAVDIAGQRVDAGSMAVFAPGRSVDFRALGDALLMLLGGEPVGPRFIEWNFVASSRERIEAAKADWRAGRMPLPPHDNREFVPLP